MHRQLVTRTQYIAELNKRLRDHHAFLPGMAFVILGGQDTEAAAGFDWVARDSDLVPPAVFAEVAAEVHTLYRVADL